MTKIETKSILTYNLRFEWSANWSGLWNLKRIGLAGPSEKPFQNITLILLVPPQLQPQLHTTISFGVSTENQVFTFSFLCSTLSLQFLFVSKDVTVWEIRNCANLHEFLRLLKPYWKMWIFIWKSDNGSWLIESYRFRQPM